MLQVQRPFWQVVPFGQALPQPPQLAASVAVSTHAEAQSVFPFGQAQTPSSQTVGVWQTVPQEPQWRESVRGSTHSSKQLI